MNKEISGFIRLLREKQISLALAESMTCGRAARTLSSYPHVSDVLSGSIVCYSPGVKSQLLKVPQRLIDQYSCESKEVTERLARNLPKVLPGNLFAALTGLAAPGGSENSRKPVGTVFISVFYKGKVRNQRVVFSGRPEEIRKKACTELFRVIADVLRKAG